MNLFLFLFPYILVPLLLSIIWKKYKLDPSGMNVLITAGIISLYPFILIEIDEYSNPPDSEGGRCGTFQAGLLILNFLIFLPFSIAMQLLFNYLFSDKKKKPAQSQPAEPDLTDTLF